ncbi:thrombospondin type-1 domain-containing protein 7A [Trichonephila clavipes]|nr:thrombospondin type-1 domain-containing protein 7A [Trichonephila clavipes]
MFPSIKLIGEDSCFQFKNRHKTNVSCLDDNDREVEPYYCLPESKGDSTYVPSALRSCEITCSSGCVLTAWTAWSPCGYTYHSTRSRRRELVGSEDGVDPIFLCA